MRRMLYGKRGISPLIATVILIGICVAGGLLIYNVFFSTTGTITQRGQVEVVTVDLVKSSKKATFSITIKNTGNKPVTSIEITLEKAGTVLTSSDSLEPGQSWSGSSSSLNSDSYTVGNEYTVTIHAVFSDDSEFTDNIKVACE